MAASTTSWSDLPDHILVSILELLPLHDRNEASKVCSSWNESFKCPLLWSHFDFHFFVEQQSRSLKCMDMYGTFLKSVSIALDQHDIFNREHACQVIERLASLKERRLKHLKITFTGENPYFYAGQEFVDALCKLFGPVPEDCHVIYDLQEIDLSGLTVSFDDILFNSLCANHPNIEKLNIQNKVLVCKVTPMCVLRLVQRCRKLRELSIHNCSMSEDLLIALTEGDRRPLEHLSIICRREEKYGKDLSSEMWSAVLQKLPNLRVTLAFDHTCPLHKVSQVMKPEIPVSVLRLETYTYIFDELHIAASYYCDTLQKLIVQTPNPRNVTEFNSALITLATKCTKLRSLHIFCLLEKRTVEEILSLLPEMKTRGSYTLKHVQEPHPWVAGNDCFN